MEDNSKYKNWKSTLAFFIFVAVYVYTVYSGKSDTVVEVTGYVALYSSIFMMFRSKITTELLSKLIDNFSKNK